MQKKLPQTGGIISLKMVWTKLLQVKACIWEHLKIVHNLGEECFELGKDRWVHEFPHEFYAMLNRGMLPTYVVRYVLH